MPKIYNFKKYIIISAELKIELQAILYLQLIFPFGNFDRSIFKLKIYLHSTMKPKLYLINISLNKKRINASFRYY